MKRDEVVEAVSFEVGRQVGRQDMQLLKIKRC